MKGVAAVLVAVSLATAACGTTVPRASQVGPGLAPGAGTAGGGTADGVGVAPSGEPGSVPQGAGGGTGAGGTAPSQPAGASAGSGPVSSGPPSVGGRSPVTAPLSIGIAYPDQGGAASALGADTGNTVTFKTAIKALVAAINLGGGLAGRRLLPVYYEFNSQSSSYSSDATAACAKFTQDNNLSVVLDTAFGKVGGFRDCLQRAGVLVISANSEGDTASSDRARLHANTLSMTTDRSYSAVLSRLAATGYLNGRNQLGVILEDCPDLSTSYRRTLVPLMSRLGLKPPVTGTIDCVTSFGSAGPAGSAIANHVLTFRSRGVDRVMLVSDYESVVLLLFGNAASAQSYRPGYALSSGAAVQVIRGNLQSDQWPQLHGVGNFYATDVDDPRSPLSPTDARCIDLAKRGGLQISGYPDRSYIYFECGPLLLLEQALRSTRGAHGASELTAAIAALGTSFLAPGTVGNATRYTPTKHDGPAQARVFRYDSSCTCLRHSGAPFPVPS